MFVFTTRPSAPPWRGALGTARPRARGAGPSVNESIAYGQLDFAYQGDLPGLVARAVDDWLDSSYLERGLRELKLTGTWRELDAAGKPKAR